MLWPQQATIYNEVNGIAKKIWSKEYAPNFDILGE